MPIHHETTEINIYFQKISSVRSCQRIWLIKQSGSPLFPPFIEHFEVSARGSGSQFRQSYYKKKNLKNLAFIVSSRKFDGFHVKSKFFKIFNVMK